MQKIAEKLKILSDAAKYDISCSSSGSYRKNQNKGLGNSDGMGICHSYTEDGRCVSLLKILLTNHCIYDCAYCVTRKSNDVKRTAFTVEEVVNLTINFYRRNYIEGLFLSSGIFKNADYTMERLVRVARTLRTQHNFNGYIHLKTIPGASQELILQAGLYADRLSVNIELPTEVALQSLAPEKNYKDILEPMEVIKQEVLATQDAKKTLRKVPNFAQAGQSTQIIVGATPDSDLTIMSLADDLYQSKNLKRVYYSGFVPVSKDTRLPADSHLPAVRENRLYQTDWLLRLYGFKLNEILSLDSPNLPADIDPKLFYALNNLHLFPVDINKADYELILRVPGIGIKSAKKIVAARKHGRIHFEHLLRIGITVSRAQYFITCDGAPRKAGELSGQSIKNLIVGRQSHSKAIKATQLNLFVI